MMDTHTELVVGIVVIATLLSIFTLVRFTREGNC